MHLATYLDFLQRTEQALADSYRTISAGHAADADVHFMAVRFATQCAAHAAAVAPAAARYAGVREPEPERLHVQAVPSHRAGPIGLLRDLQELHQLAGLTDLTWTLVRQAAQGARDLELLHVTDACAPQTAAQLGWLAMRTKAAAAQTLLAAP